MERKIQKSNWILIGIALFLFAILLVLMIENYLEPFDRIIFQTMRKFQNEGITNLFLFFTWIGGTISVITLAIIFSLFVKEKKYAIYLWINLILVVLINQSMKYIIERPRPQWERLTSATGYSFPSGHTMTAVAFYGFFIYYVGKTVKNKTAKICLSIGLILIAILIGISRIYLGVHYASDVLAGGFLSFAYIIIYLTNIRQYDEKIVNNIGKKGNK